VIELIERILQRGVEAGEIRRGLDAVDIHMLISSFCVFRVANRYTFQTIFERDLLDGGDRQRYRTMLGDVIARYVSADAS
jgi:hypothetical protein